MDEQGVRVLVVDDEEPVRRIVTRVLEKSGYSCSAAADVAEARHFLAGEEYAVCFTDMTMPGASGLDLLEELAVSYPDVATVMVTGVDDPQLAERALEVGAYGYIVKPFEANEILINMANALRRRTLEIDQRSQRGRLERMVKERTAELWNAISGLEKAEKELMLSREETVQKLSTAAEYRDNETARHIQRMSGYCGLLAVRVTEDQEEGELIRLASIMHDVGKIGIPDSVLRKPGRFTEEERLEMQKHAEIGHKILKESQSPLLVLAADIALTHHEKWDGSGYPRGLVGEDIPEPGRIAAIADVFDALISRRVYKEPIPLGRSIQIMQEGRGNHFDPRLLDIFLDSLDEVIRIVEANAEP